MSCARTLQKLDSFSLPIPAAASEYIQKIDRQLFPPRSFLLRPVDLPTPGLMLIETFIKAIPIGLALTAGGLSLPSVNRYVSQNSHHLNQQLVLAIAVFAISCFPAIALAGRVKAKHSEAVFRRNFLNFCESPFPSRILIDHVLDESFFPLIEQAKETPELLLKKSAEGLSILSIYADQFSPDESRFRKLYEAVPWSPEDLLNVSKVLLSRRHIKLFESLKIETKNFSKEQSLQFENIKLKIRESASQQTEKI